MRYNECVEILNKVANHKAERTIYDSASHWDRLNIHWEDNGYYTLWGFMLGGTDNTDESREEIVFYIKPTNYPNLEELPMYEIDGLQEYYDDEEFGISDEDIEAINNGNYVFDDFEIMTEWHDYNNNSCDETWMSTARELIRLVDIFAEETKPYQTDYNN